MIRPTQAVQISRRRPMRRATATATAAAGLFLAAAGCASFPRYAEYALENRDWRLVELHGQPAVPSTGMREAGLRFGSDSLRVSGSGGCNRIAGTYTRDGDRLTFGPMLSTRMACADARLNRQEVEFLGAIQATTRYEITRDTLILARDGESLARLAPAPR
jgi:heat shock protein HslJ